MGFVLISMQIAVVQIEIWTNNFFFALLDNERASQIACRDNDTIVTTTCTYETLEKVASI